MISGAASFVALLEVLEPRMLLSAGDWAGTWYFTGFGTDATRYDSGATFEVGSISRSATVSDLPGDQCLLKISGETTTFALTNSGDVLTGHFTGPEHGANKDDYFRIQLISPGVAVLMEANAGFNAAGSSSLAWGSGVGGILTRTKLSAVPRPWEGKYDVQSWEFQAHDDDSAGTLTPDTFTSTVTKLSATSYQGVRDDAPENVGLLTASGNTLFQEYTKPEAGGDTFEGRTLVLRTTGDWLLMLEGGASFSADHKDIHYTSGSISILQPQADSQYKPDLRAAIGAIPNGGLLIPGETVKVPVTIYNDGNAAAAGNLRIDLYASGDDQLDKDLDALMATLTKSINIPAGGSQTLYISVPVPADAAAGQVQLIADVDPQGAFGELQEDNNQPVSGPAAISWKFGTVNGRTKAATLVLKDADGSVATFSLKGKGTGEVTLVDGRWDLNLTGTDATSAVSVKVKGGDGRITLGTIRGTQGTEALKSITAASVNLSGEGIDLGGFLGTLAIRDLLNGADVLAGGLPAQKSKITVHEIGDGTTIDIGSSISSLSATRIGRADLFAPSIASLSTKEDKNLGIPGDFSADVTISGEGVAAGKLSLGKLSIGGMYRDGLVLVNGNVGSVKTTSVAQDVPEQLFGIDAKAVKSAVSVNPVFAWMPKGPADQSLGDFHVIAETQPGAWPLKDAAWDLDAPGTVETITWQNSLGQTIQSEALSGEVQIVVNPWKTSLARVEKMVSAHGGTLFAQLPAAGLYWANVPAGEEAEFISVLAGPAISAFPNLVTGLRAQAIATNWAEVDSAVIPGLGGMGTGNIDLEGLESAMDVSGAGDYILKLPNGNLAIDANGHFIETTDPSKGATHTDVVNYYRSAGGNLYQIDPTITEANSTVAIPTTSGPSTVCDITSMAAVIQRASELGDTATINFSWGNAEYKPWAPGAPAGYETYNQANAAVYLASMQGMLESHVKGAADALIVQAAGNAATDLSSALFSGLNLHPTAAGQIIEVGALDGAGNIASYSNYSSTAGTMIYVPVTDITDQGRGVVGTSFAAPQLQYLVYQIRKNRPDLTPDQIREILFDPSVSPLQTVPRPNAPVGETMTVPVIENPYDPAVLQAALAVAETIDPLQGITVSPTSGLVTSEGGQKATFTVVLDSPPTAKVTIALASSDTSEGKVSKSSLTFTPANWSVPQTVVVTGVNDSLADGNQAYTIITSPAVSEDPAYSGLNADDVSVTNMDDESPTISLDQLSVVKREEELIPNTFGDILRERFKVSGSGTAAGPVGTYLYTYPGAIAGSFVMDEWSVDIAGNHYRAAGDPPSTHFTFEVYTDWYAVSSEPLSPYTVKVEADFWDPDPYLWAKDSKTIALQ